MAGYSGTPLARKLGYREGMRCFWRNAPSDYPQRLGELPADIEIATTPDGRFDVIHCFATRRSQLEADLGRLRPTLKDNGMFWISWPKQSAVKAMGIDTDLDGNTVRHLGLVAGLVDIKVCAVDDTWSALKFVIPKQDRGQ